MVMTALLLSYDSVEGVDVGSRERRWASDWWTDVPPVGAGGRDMPHLPRKIIQSFVYE